MDNNEVLKGFTNTILLKLLSKNDSYGYEITKAVENDSEGFFKITQAACYKSLNRLEKDGYVEIYWKKNEGTPQRKYYKITDLGIIRLEANYNEWLLVSKYLGRLIGVRDE